MTEMDKLEVVAWRRSNPDQPGWLWSFGPKQPDHPDVHALVRLSDAQAAIDRAAQSSRVEVERLRGALSALAAACRFADVCEELSDHIDGSLLDAADEALYPPIWTDEQVAMLEARQADGRMHPYTCGNDRSDALHVAQAVEDGEEHQPGKLIPTRGGWVCPACDYRQFWSHETKARSALSASRGVG